MIQELIFRKNIYNRVSIRTQRRESKIIASVSLGSIGTRRHKVYYQNHWSPPFVLQALHFYGLKIPVSVNLHKVFMSIVNSCTKDIRTIRHTTDEESMQKQKKDVHVKHK